MRLPGLWLALFVTAPEPLRRTLACREVLTVIQCYVDCECDVGTMLVIATHLDHCCACAAELETLRWLKAAVRRCHDATESRLWL